MKTALVAVAVLAGTLSPMTARAQLPVSQVVLENPSVRVTPPPIADQFSPFHFAMQFALMPPIEVKAPPTISSPL